MKRTWPVLILIAALTLFSLMNTAPTLAQTETPTPTETPTLPPPATTRPILIIDSYGSGEGAIRPGNEFELGVRLVNIGGEKARNIIATFTSTDFYPKDTGGVVATPVLAPSADINFHQPMLADTDLWGRTLGVITMTLSYTNNDGSISYSETFVLTIDIQTPNWVAATATPTISPLVPRPQIVVDSYASDVDPLQPGTIFNLTLNLRNLGNADARAVSMVLGGGVTLDASGTPQPGGVSGSGSDLSTFAPLGSSNVIYLGDLLAANTTSTTMQLIVNVSANPGAYPLKLAFVYTDPKNNRLLDDQVITLLIYSLPQLDVNFYTDPGIFFSNSMNMLPLQVTNLGRKSAVLGNITVTSENADITNNTALVGALEPGGYFTLDAQVMPYAAGPLDLTVTINYTDDFNMVRTVTQTLTVNVEEMYIEPIPGENGEPPIIEPEPETFWDKVLRFFKGLFGLDSAEPTPEPIPAETFPEDKPIEPIPGGKG